MRKKLIEVALPLEVINKEAAREKSIRHGHPSTLHLWWARRPLAACRAVLFASLIDDPDQEGVPQELVDRIDRLPKPERPQGDWERLSLGEQRRERLFAFIEQLVKWENSNNERVIGTARELIMAATGGNPPPVLDPFCGGGSIPLEAQRLGLEAHASDLNPVAVLITKALIEIPPKFANMPPVNPVDRAQGMGAQWKGAAGLAADVRYYGKWMRDEAEKRIGHLYPKVKLPEDRGGGEATVIAWLWARTVKCPNPACGVEMPLVRSFWLSSREGGKAWIEPEVNRQAKTIQYLVKMGQGVPREGTVDRHGAVCILCGQPVQLPYVRAEGRAGRLGVELMAVAAALDSGRGFLPAATEQGTIAANARPKWFPDTHLPLQHRSISAQLYGLNQHGKLFTGRQLLALTAFSDLVIEARDQVRRDSASGGMHGEQTSVATAAGRASAYADAVATYLALAVDKMADTNTTLCTWQIDPPRLRATFGRQSLPMTWDFAEANVFGHAAGDYQLCIGSLCEVLDRLSFGPIAHSKQLDAISALVAPQPAMLCTDPPYYDNVGYSELSDFFYVWLRRSVGSIHPDLFVTLLTPKEQELVANRFRFDGDRDKASDFFEHGLESAFVQTRNLQHPDYPLTVFYAFKQAEETDDNYTDRLRQTVSTGWETMLRGLLRSGFAITGTWPMRSELATRNVSRDTNALASSIVLVCRPRPFTARLATRSEFNRALKTELPDALRKLQHGNIAPVDLAQAAIGPGMAIFSRYSKVLEADGSPMSIRSALTRINQALDEVLSEQESEYDADTRWAVAWFEQFRFAEGPFGAAETLSTAKNTSVGGLVHAGILAAKAGKVRLLHRDELRIDWDPTTDRRITVWEVTQHLIRALENGGEQAAAELLRKVGGLGEVARDLAYRLYITCERKKWAQEGLAYNSLVVAWPEIARLAAQQVDAMPTRMF